ncbi:MAG TPA: lysophospholipid acyltransferase family protein [Longimicrobiales bacterium]|nr:lysophospholipid acyltransferase family protein [Longimicrobiales bacterium]
MTSGNESRRVPARADDRDGLKYVIGGFVGWALVEGLLATTRIEAINDEAYKVHLRAGKPVIFALWHGRMVPPTYRHRHQDIVTLASQSADGEYITRLLQRWGYHVARGSSTRGAESALRDLIRLARAGRTVALTADGPRGPREQLKLGVLHIAQLSGAPLIPIACAASRAWWFESWDRFLVPRPFARIRVVYGDAIFIPRDADRDALDRAARSVEAVIADLTAEAEAPFS